MLTKIKEWIKVLEIAKDDCNFWLSGRGHTELGAGKIKEEMKTLASVIDFLSSLSDAQMPSVDELTNLILNVAMAHHDDISQSDEDKAVEVAETLRSHLFAVIAKLQAQWQEKAGVERIEKIIREFILFEYQEGQNVLPVEFQDFIKDKPDFFNALAQALSSYLTREE